MRRYAWVLTVAGAFLVAPATRLEGQSQSQSLVEAGIFGQFTHFDKNAGCPCIRPENAAGIGARLGYFFSPTWELEADAARANPRVKIVGGTLPYTTYAARLNYNVWRERTSFLVGLGAVHNSFHHADWGASGIAGARLGLNDRVAVRVDEVVDYMPPIKNFNLTTRLGLSWFFGRRAKATQTPVVFVEPPAPLPPTPPVPPPAPAAAPRPPAAVLDTAAITEPIYFDYDRANIRPDAESTLERKLPWLRANPEMRIRIEGNADQRGSDEYNLALGQRRAVSARSWLSAHGIAPVALDASSLGEERPVCTENEESCWQKNRRADFRIVTYPRGGIVIPSME